MVIHLGRFRFQIAAHEEVIPLDELYRGCEIARGILTGDNAVGRVIARPFVGIDGDTEERRTDATFLSTVRPRFSTLKENGKTVIAVGKIHDIFAGRGISESIHTDGNTDGMNKTLDIASRDFDGLCFVNLVDFDMLYGHRRDIPGYARALSEFDAFLPSLISKLGDDDVLIITADHGCDPGYSGTDHTRVYTAHSLRKGNISQMLGTRSTYADIAATAATAFGVPLDTPEQIFSKKSRDTCGNKCTKFKWIFCAFLQCLKSRNQMHLNPLK
ncbi:MAG: phosphopentomutase [Lachnospiraceae bacterium]